MKKRAVAAILMAGVLFAAGLKPVQAAPKVDTYGEYHAALGVQTDSTRRVFRDAYFDGTSEKKSDFKKLKKERSSGSGADRAEEMDGKFTDTVIKGNGTYAVSLKNADFSGNRSFRKLYVATDIPNTQDIKFSNMTVSIDGRVLRTFSEAVLDESRTYRKNCVLLAIHPVNEDVKRAISTRTVPVNRENVIKIRFTVSGFDYDKGETPQTPSPKPTRTPEVTEEPVKQEETTASSEPAPTEPAEDQPQEEPGEVPIGNQVGIFVTIVAAIGGVLACLAVVSKRNH